VLLLGVTLQLLVLHRLRSMEMISQPSWTFSLAWGNRVGNHLEMKPRMKRKRWTILIALIALLLVPQAATLSAETPLKTINVAVPAVSLLQAPLFVAIDAGAFKKYGMDVRYVLTGARTIQALIGGSVQFAQGVSSRTVPSAVLGGADAILIANFVDKFLFTMHSAPEINSV
jgi:ABC-type nitrate/sulfonate/bicarbonate transport system substrate-binding protein